MTLQEFKAANPGVHVEAHGGPWLTVYCRGVGVRYESYFSAHKEAREACARCDGSKPHPIFEIREAQPESIRLREYHEKRRN
jgi:hypothetical protein